MLRIEPQNLPKFRQLLSKCSDEYEYETDRQNSFSYRKVKIFENQSTRWQNHKKKQFHQKFATIKQPKTENLCDRRQLEAEVKNSY